MNRHQKLIEWINNKLGEDVYQLESIKSDASFRQYFRVIAEDKPSIIAMDAPPSHEDSESFQKVAIMMAKAGLNVPKVLYSNIEHGFLLLTDLGKKSYIDILNKENAQSLFLSAIDELIKWQLATSPNLLPQYNRDMILKELCLFRDWYLETHLRLKVDKKLQDTLDCIFEDLIKNALNQPQVFVHRDFMPRNIMVGATKPGIIDFQDAVIGPITYDLVSLLRDAFISWNKSFVSECIKYYWEKAKKSDLPVRKSYKHFIKELDFMGVQRHLKILGIFARLVHRDGKPTYMSDAPRFLTYLEEASSKYDNIKPLHKLITETIKPLHF